MPGNCAGDPPPNPDFDAAVSRRIEDLLERHHPAVFRKWKAHMEEHEGALMATPQLRARACLFAGGVASVLSRIPADRLPADVPETPGQDERMRRNRLLLARLVVRGVQCRAEGVANA